MKLLLIADVSNLYYSIALKYGPYARLDYKKFYNTAAGMIGRSKDQVQIQAIAYGADLDGIANAFKMALTYIGFELKYKEPKRYYNAKNPERESRKADWDVGMAMDIVKILPTIDGVILGTADGDLAPCVQFVRDAGKECRILACGISRELKDLSNQWVEIPEEMLKCSTPANHSSDDRGTSSQTDSSSILTESV